MGVKIVQSLEKDSNSNDIPDWEEALWGLNPKKDGEANKEFILNKRKALNPNGDFSSYEEDLSESDSLAREFFAVVMALQQTGDLDEEAINAIGEAASEKIVAEPIPDIYTMDMVKILEDNPESLTQYYNNFKKVSEKYTDKNIGDELTFLIQAIAYDDEQIVSLLGSIGSAYREFGQDLIKIPTPLTLSPINLALANSYEKNAQSIEGFVSVFSDPIIATKSIINYKKYNNELVVLINSLSSIFSSQ